MKPTGDSNLLVMARGALLDALEALSDHLDVVILVGAQAIYLHTGDASVALAEMTKDSDLALDIRTLADEPLIEKAMSAAGFRNDPAAQQPGAWISAKGVPVDLMVPQALSPGSGRGARIPPHSKRAARRAAGLEAAIIDHAPIKIKAMASGDSRVRTAKVAGPAALLVAKLHKIGERQETAPHRLVDKDAHDIYRLLVASRTEALASTLTMLRQTQLAGPVTEQALTFLAKLFAAGPDALGAMMAGRAEEGIGNPATVAASASILAVDLLSALMRG